jgi:hypothetical protein
MLHLVASSARWGLRRPTVPIAILATVFAVLITLFFSHTSWAAQVTLAWDPSSGPNIAGYKLYYGTSSRNYLRDFDAGNVTTYTITGLSDGQTYYIAATAYDTQRHESAFSDEVSITFGGNRAPVAKNGTLTTMQNTHASDVLRANDGDGNALSYRIVDNGGKGRAVILNPATGSFTYSPNHNITGTDTFTFVANDGKVDSNEATIKVNITPNASITYENAKLKTLSKWTVIDKKPAAALVRNVYDKKRHSRVIEFKGDGTQNAYRLRNADGSKWNNSTQNVLRWSMSYSQPFKIYVDVQTTAGQRFITYTPASSDKLGSGKYVYFGIGSGAIPGQWHTFTRDLQADLEKAQPNVSIQEVNGLIIRGSLRIDGIQLLQFLPCDDTDADGICDDDEVYVYGTDPLKADTSSCGIGDGYKRDYLAPRWNADTDGNGIINLLDDDMDNDGFLDGYEIAHGSDPLSRDSIPPS